MVGAIVLLLRLTVSSPTPILMVLIAAEMVAVSAPEPRATFSRFENVIEPSVPELAAETLSSLALVTVETRVSLPP